MMTVLDHPQRLSVTEATQRGVAGMMLDAEAGDIVVTRRGEPVAAVISMQRLVRIEGMLDDLRDLSLALSRAMLDDGGRVSFDDVLAAYGLTHDDLDAADDDAEEPSASEPAA